MFMYMRVCVCVSAKRERGREREREREREYLFCFLLEVLVSIIFDNFYIFYTPSHFECMHVCISDSMLFFLHIFRYFYAF